MQQWGGGGGGDAQQILLRTDVPSGGCDPAILQVAAGSHGMHVFCSCKLLF